MLKKTGPKIWQFYGVLFVAGVLSANGFEVPFPSSLLPQERGVETNHVWPKSTLPAGGQNMPKWSWMLIKSPTKSTFLLDFSCGTILGGRLGYEKWFRPQNIAQAGVDFVCGLSRRVVKTLIPIQDGDIQLGVNMGQPSKRWACTILDPMLGYVGLSLV